MTLKLLGKNQANGVETFRCEVCHGEGVVWIPPKHRVLAVMGADVVRILDTDNAGLAAFIFEIAAFAVCMTTSGTDHKVGGWWWSLAPVPSYYLIRYIAKWIASAYKRAIGNPRGR